MLNLALFIYHYMAIYQSVKNIEKQCKKAVLKK